MPLELILGPANAAKAGEVLSAYRAALPRGPILVVPTRGDVVHYERELASDQAVLGGSVVAFGGLAREIAARAGFAAPRVGRVQRERLIAAAAEAADPAVVGSSVGSPGFAAAAGELIAELERSRVTPQRLAAALENAVEEREAAGIYMRYWRALERRGLVDDDLFAWRAVDALAAAPAGWGASPVFLYGFDDLTPVQRRAIETLAGIPGVDVTVSLTYEPRTALAGRARTVEDLRPVAARVRDLPPLPDYYAAPALHHLERHLFEPEAERADAGDAVVLLEAGGERAEVELVAAEALALLRAGVPADQIAVVHRSPRSVAPLVAQVFSAYGVPFAQDRRVPLHDTALGRGVLALLRCALDPDAPAGELVAYLRTPGLLRRPELADRLEATVRRRAVRGAAEARALWEQANPEWKLDALDRLGERRVATSLRRAVTDLLAAPHRRAAPILDGPAREDAAAAAEMLAALEELEALGGVDARGALDALERLEVRLEDPARAGAVLVTDPLGIRARRFRAVIVFGLQERAFPRRATPDPFLGEDARRDLAASAGLVLRRPVEDLVDERALFYACASRAEERLVLAYRTADEDGNPALPSPFVEDVRRLFTDLPVRSRPLAAVTWDQDDAPTERERARAQALAGPRVPPEPIGALTSAAAIGALRHQEVLSAGALESYADCPAKWLVERELQPRALEPDSDAIARGAFIHRVLERTLGDLRARTGSARLTPASRDVAEELLRAAIEEEREREPLAATPGAAAAAAARAEADLLAYLDHASQTSGPYEPAHLEYSFGIEEGAPALWLDQGALKIRGVIDRVDVDPDARTAIVHDYKSGRPAPDWPVARWQRDRRLQVALYMLAVRDLLRLEPVGGVYQPLGTDRRARGVLLDTEEHREMAGTAFVETDLVDAERLAEELAAAERSAVELARSLRSGEVEPRPDTCAARGCRYPGICRSAAL
jgi:ATP-dependent helicase/DNAse subunit B